MWQYEDELNKRKEEINILSLAVNEYDKSTKTSSKVKLSDQVFSISTEIYLEHFSKFWHKG